MTAVAMTTETVGVSARLKDAAAAAVLAVLLCMPIVFLHADADMDGVLHPIPRPWPVAILAFLAFFGRLAALNFAEGRTHGARRQGGRNRRLARRGRQARCLGSASPPCSSTRCCCC